MKHHIEALIAKAVESLQEAGTLPQDLTFNMHVERARGEGFGDYASNVAMMLAKSAGMKPRDFAEKIVANFPDGDVIDRVEIAGPGFINFFVSATAKQQIIQQIFAEQDAYGKSNVGAGEKIHLEYVSANPTGPLHVGHGRGAAYGSTMAAVLKATGFNVHQEYYVNDAGRQMNILAASTWLRYLEVCGEALEFPSNGYRGDYIVDIARKLYLEHKESLRHSAADVFQGVPDDEPAGGDKDKHVDGLIRNAKDLLGEKNYKIVFDLSLKEILDDIKLDLFEFGVKHDEYFSESHFVHTDKLKVGLKKLKKSGLVYDKDEAMWFKASELGDEKDRVVIKADGSHTYFATDTFYHAEKFERGFDKVVDVFGSDHHGYVPRMKAALKAMGYDADRFQVQLCQFVNLVRNGEPVKMSTRSGSFITLRELREEVGNDATRFFYLMCKHAQHMEFDLELAKSKSNENPVYYVQYAHARICSVFRQLEEKGMNYEQEVGLQHLKLLVADQELKLLTTLDRYPEVLQMVVRDFEPYYLTQYLRDLATDMHAYYNAHHFIVDDAELRAARLCLIVATRQVLKNGLELLGIKAVENM